MVIILEGLGAHYRRSSAGSNERAHESSLTLRHMREMEGVRRKQET